MRKYFTFLILISTVVIIGSGFSYASKPSDFGLKEGDLISAIFSDDPDVYIINDQGYKRLFLNPEIFKFYSHLGGFANIKLVTPEVRDSFPTSGFFRNCEDNDQKVFGTSVEGEDTGRLHWINKSGDQAVQEDPDFFKKVFCINRKEFNWYPRGNEFKELREVPQYNRSVEVENPVICHHPSNDPKTFQTIRIAPESLDTHFQHGDTKGACSTSSVQQTFPVDVKINNSDNPASVPYDSIFTVSWTSNGAVSCRDFGQFIPAVDGGTWAKYINLPTSGAKSLYARTEGQGYLATFDIQVQCTNATGQTQDDMVHLSVKPPVETPAITPTATYLIKPMVLKDILKIESVIPYDVANLSFGVYRVSAQYNLGAYHQGKWYEGLNPGISGPVWIEFGWPNMPQVDIVLRDENDQQRKIYLPATGPNKNPDGSSSNWYYWISEDGSSYYGRKDHNYGWPDLSSVEALRPEHLARKAGVSVPTPTPIPTPTPTPTSISNTTYDLAVVDVIPDPAIPEANKDFTVDVALRNVGQKSITNPTAGLNIYDPNGKIIYSPATGYIGIVNPGVTIVVRFYSDMFSPRLTETTLNYPAGIYKMVGNINYLGVVDGINYPKDPYPNNDTFTKMLEIKSVFTSTPTPTPSSQSVTVTSPNGGECMAGIMPISWSSPLGTEVKWWDLNYSVDNGLSYWYVMWLHNYNARSYSWATYDVIKKSDINSSQALIKARACGGTFPNCTDLGKDISDKVFSINTICPGGIPPVAPTNLTATPKTYSNGTLAVTVNWTDNSSNELGFAAYKRIKGSSQWDVPSISTGTGMEYQGLQTGTTYEFMVRGGNQYGYSADSNIATAIVGSTATNDAKNFSSNLANISKIITRDLYIGSTGDDVKQLQALLVNEVGYSADLLTGYFGRITRDAVKRLQEKYSIKPTHGYFGEITRKTLNALISSQ